MANMPEEMMRGNVAEETEVSEESGTKSARDVSVSSYQDRSSGEVMVYMGQGFGLTCQVMEQMLWRRWNCHEVIGLYLFFLPGRRFLCLKWNHGNQEGLFGCFSVDCVPRVLKFVNF